VQPVKLRKALPVLRVVVAVALLAAAILMWQNMPTKTQIWAPIAIDATMGERAVGRNLAVTVHRVDLADAVTFAQRGKFVRVPATAAWLVFSLTYEALHEIDAAPKFQLVTEGRTYESTVGNFSGTYPPGVTKRGVAAFELPDVPAEAVLKIANKTTEKWGNAIDAPLDSQISLPVDLGALTVERSVDLDELSQ
jgi:hypothetical protein